MNQKKYFITYSDKGFKKQKKYAILTAKYLGKFDYTYSFSNLEIEKDFFEKYKNILTEPRGGGYWLWKPYFIYKTLEDINFGDYLFYSDSGVVFLKKVDILISELNKINQDIMGFELPLIEEQWTKKELFNNLNCNEEKYVKSNQILASFILLKKTEFSLTFFKKFLKIATDEINITDKQIIFQSKSFIEHRHDQSIFSLLYKKHSLIPFKDPSQYGYNPCLYLGFDNICFNDHELHKINNLNFRINKYNSTYSNVLFHYRKSNLFKSLLKYFVSTLFKKKHE